MVKDITWKHQKQAERVICILDKVHFKANKTTKEKKENYIMTKWLLNQQNDTTCVYIKQNHNIWSKTNRAEKKNRQIQNYSWVLPFNNR